VTGRAKAKAPQCSPRAGYLGYLGYLGCLVQQWLHESWACDPEHVGKQHQQYKDNGDCGHSLEYGPHHQIASRVKRALGHGGRIYTRQMTVSSHSNVPPSGLNGLAVPPMKTAWCSINMNFAGGFFSSFRKYTHLLDLLDFSSETVPFINGMREGFFGGFMNRNFGPRATLFGAGATPVCSIGGFAGAMARGK
jgi:hypothetical protein